MFKVGDKVKIKDAYYSNGRKYGEKRREFIGLKGTISEKSYYRSEIYDWVVVFTTVKGYKSHWWFHSKHLQLLNPQLTFVF